VIYPGGPGSITLHAGEVAEGEAMTEAEWQWPLCRAWDGQAVVLSRGVNYCTDFLVPSGQDFVGGTPPSRSC